MFVRTRTQYTYLYALYFEVFEEKIVYMYHGRAKTFVTECATAYVSSYKKILGRNPLDKIEETKKVLLPIFCLIDHYFGWFTDLEVVEWPFYIEFVKND